MDLFRFGEEADATSKEYSDITDPFRKVFDSCMLEYYVPEVCAYYIALGYKMDALWEYSFDIHIGTVLDDINRDYQVTQKLKLDVKRILELKYGLHTICEEPLQFQE